MNFTHAAIEEMMADLPEWVERKKNPKSVFRRTGFRGAIKLAIYYYHKDENLERSQRYLDDLMNRLKLKNARRRDEAEQVLASYADWWGASRTTAVPGRLRLKFVVDKDLTIGGDISRIDLGVDEFSYKGILLGIHDPGWKRQLRMPVVQAAIAARLGRDPSEVGVGIQELDGTGLQVKHYSEKEMIEAIREVRALAHKARQLLER